MCKSISNHEALGLSYRSHYGKRGGDSDGKIYCDDTESDTLVTLLTASRKMAVFASVLLAGVSLFASGRCVGIQGRSCFSFLNAQSSPDSAQVSASYFSHHDPILC